VKSLCDPEVSGMWSLNYNTEKCLSWSRCSWWNGTKTCRIIEL